MTIDRIQGTDGIRGPVCFAENSAADNPIAALLHENVLTEEFFELYTYAYCQELLESGFAKQTDLVVIGWDPRDLSGRFNQAAVSGIRKSGLTAVVVDILPTPAIALYQLHIKAACGFVLTASHNPADQNGIKIFLGHSNLKLFPEDDKRLTQRCLGLDYDELRSTPVTGEVRNEHQLARSVFLAFMADSENHWLAAEDLAGTTIIVDAANGAFSHLIKDLLRFEQSDFVFANCDPAQGINVRSGVADLEGISIISASEIENGLFSGYVALQQLLSAGRSQKEILNKKSGLVLGFIFDGDGDRCFLLSYDPFQDCVLVLDGDILAFLQAKLLKQNYPWKQSPLFVNTVESDLEAGRAVQQAGFETVQCAVGDKWILWQAWYHNWCSKNEYILSKTTDPEFIILLKNTTASLDLMVTRSKFDALFATKTMLEVENFILKKSANELLSSASAHTCRQYNNSFAIGSEQSGHVITLAKLGSGKLGSPVFSGNGLKCALNSLAAIQHLLPENDSPAFFKWLKRPFPSGYQKSLPVYYVDKSLLDEGSALREKLIELLLSELKWPEMEVEIVKREEEPEMLLLNVLQKGFLLAAVFVRNSGTEDKLALYLRGKADLSARLETLAEKIYPFLLSSFKSITNPMAKAELTVLNCLKAGAKQTSDLKLNNLANISTERLLHEMSSRQKLIRKEGELWSITETGRICLNHSERSEKTFQMNG
ncbi:MAG: hypothetical protein H8E38_09230 [SAR324 cluster bacterium]|nr:hypothetical protein [SAR324 cluster bacterium]